MSLIPNLKQIQAIFRDSQAYFSERKKKGTTGMVPFQKGTPLNLI